MVVLEGVILGRRTRTRLNSGGEGNGGGGARFGRGRAPRARPGATVTRFNWGTINYLSGVKCGSSCPARRIPEFLIKVSTASHGGWDSECPRLTDQISGQYGSSHTNYTGLRSHVASTTWGEEQSQSPTSSSKRAQRPKRCSLWLLAVTLFLVRLFCFLYYRQPSQD